MTESGKLLKMEVDYSDAVDKNLPELREMAKVRGLLKMMTVAYVVELQPVSF